MKEFKLPDLGEGLTEAEIVKWHVSADQHIELNQPLLSVETDKAVVEVPSPVSGRVLSLHGEPGDVIPVGDVLARFDTGRHDDAREQGLAPSPEDKPSLFPEQQAAPAADAGDSDEAGGKAPGVVGELPASGLVLSDTTQSGSAAPRGRRVKAAPSVRALARELGVDIALIEGSGPQGRITAKDIAKAAGQNGAGQRGAPSSVPAAKAPGSRGGQDAALAPDALASGQEKLTGPRRAMFKSMTAAHSEAALCTVMDDADIHDWKRPRDFTPRLIRAMVAGCRAEPRLNGTFSAEAGLLSVSENVNMGLAMHTPHGLIVASIPNAHHRSLDELRGEVARLKQAGAERTLTPEEVRGYTITLSNIAGGSSRYATPLMVPPTVAILGSGAAREEVVALSGAIAIRRMLPLSLTFDHRCVAGAEAARFLSAVVADLKQAS